MINIRAKGANFERLIATDLNRIINASLVERGFALPVQPIVQRNQNQSEVGGCDFVGAFGLAIEAKAQETLSVNTWWAQCETSAKRLQQTPVLIYKQNNKKIQVCMECEIPYPYMPSVTMRTRVTFEYEVFLKWFRDFIQRNIERGWVPVY